MTAITDINGSPLLGVSGMTGMKLSACPAAEIRDLPSLALAGAEEPAIFVRPGRRRPDLRLRPRPPGHPPTQRAIPLGRMPL